MDKSHSTKLAYPIKTIHVGDFPLLDELLGRGRSVVNRVGFDPASNSRFLEGMRLADGETALEILDRARASGTLEPLASLAYSLVPQNARSRAVNIQGLLLPYQQHVDNTMRELSQNISLQVQTTPDNTWGDVILANGLLLMKSAGTYIVYRYSMQGGATKQVVFERMPDLKSPDLETTIAKYHNPEAIESPVLVKSRKSYPAKEDILPFFAYRLTGLKR